MKKLFENWREYALENKRSSEDSNQVVKIVLFDEDNKVLVLKNDKHGWDLPGGHIKKEEPMEKGLRREVKEETGLTITDFSKLDYEQDNKSYYKGPVPNKNIVLSDEHDSYDFVIPEEIKNIDIRDSFKKAIDTALESQ